MTQIVHPTISVKIPESEDDCTQFMKQSYFLMALTCLALCISKYFLHSIFFNSCNSTDLLEACIHEKKNFQNISVPAYFILSLF